MPLLVGVPFAFGVVAVVVVTVLVSSAGVVAIMDMVLCFREEKNNDSRTMEDN